MRTELEKKMGRTIIKVMLFVVIAGWSGYFIADYIEPERCFNCKVELTEGNRIPNKYICEECAMEEEQ